MSSHALSVQEGYLLLKITGALKDEDANRLSEEFAKHVSAKPLHLIVDCSDQQLNQVWIRQFVLFHLKLKNEGKFVRLVNANALLKTILTEQGILKSLPICKDVKTALIELGVQSATLDVNFINPFLMGAVEVLSIQAATKAVAGKPYPRTNEKFPLGDISGVIGLVSNGFTGTVIISFPEAVFLTIMSRMLGEPVTEITREIQDGASELTNIIFGKAKSILNQQGYNIQMALPSVVTGTNHLIYSNTHGPRVVIPFETDGGSFFIEICLSS